MLCSKKTESYAVLDYKREIELVPGLGNSGKHNQISDGYAESCEQSAN